MLLEMEVAPAARVVPSVSRWDSAVQISWTARPSTGRTCGPPANEDVARVEIRVLNTSVALRHDDLIKDRTRLRSFECGSREPVR